MFDNEKIPADLQPVVETVYQLNPMYLVTEGFRWACFGHHTDAPSLTSLASLIGLALVLLTGLFYFRRTEVTFADVV